MKIAIKKTDIPKIGEGEIRSLFGAEQIDEMEYNSSELTQTLNEIVFEFDYSKEVEFLEYLKEHLITGYPFK